MHGGQGDPFPNPLNHSQCHEPANPARSRQGCQQRQDCSAQRPKAEHPLATVPLGQETARDLRGHVTVEESAQNVALLLGVPVIVGSQIL